jgi:V8-like Glu-specific endopeptidase
MAYDMEFETYETDQEYGDAFELDSGEFELEQDSGEFEDTGYEFEGDTEFEAPGGGVQIQLPRIGDRSGFDETQFEVEGEEEIFPPDDRKPVLDTAPIPYRYICHIKVGYKSDDGRVATGIGTGTLIGDCHVLTVAHNLKIQLSGSMFKAAKITVTPGRNTSFSSSLKWTPFGDYQAKSWFPHSKFTGTTAGVEYDYGLIILKTEVGKKTFRSLGNKPFGYWGSPKYGGGTVIRPLDPAKLKDKIVNVCGYPFDKCGKDPDAGSCNKNKKQGTQFIAYDKVLNPAPAAQPRLLDHRADIRQGHSGSPVWRWEPDKKLRCMVSVQSFEETSSAGTPLRNSGPRITSEVLAQLKKWGWPG